MVRTDAETVLAVNWFFPFPSYSLKVDWSSADIRYIDVPEDLSIRFILQ
jgi:hypothetical protein